MKFLAVLNRDGGTLQTTDLSAFSTRLHEILEGAGHRVVIDIVDADKVAAALDKAATARGVDVVLIGGGDGTISSAAARLMGRKKALAILPAGTMNLFARGLGIPQNLEKAVHAFAGGQIVAVDMASANGRPFIHQFSVGMHARMVQLREKMDFGSRFGKIRASARAAWTTINDPPAMKVTLTIGEAEVVTSASGIGVTNNLFGENHLPYADNPAGGLLGIYVTMTRQRGELLQFFFNMARGKWRDNQHVEIHQADRAVMEIVSSTKKPRAVLDGELVALEPKTVFEIHPQALRVLVPAGATDKPD